MNFLKGLLWFLFAIAVIAVAMYVTGNYELADRLTGFFLIVQPFLPLTLNFDQFLVVVTVASLLVSALAISGSAGLVVFLASRLSVAQQKQIGQAAAARRELDHVTTQHQRQYEQLRLLSQTLTKRLDKRMLVQAIVEAASHLASVSKANGVVSLWLLRFETDTLRFEMGLYCDETLFAQTEFQPTEQPFARVISTQKSWIMSEWDPSLKFVKPESLAHLGAATAMIAVPLIIENAVLGTLVLFCHPDVIKGYEAQRPYYEAMWGELTLALAVAIQGELTILDRLTGTHNREYFMKRLVQEMERANRYQLPVSLLMVDIDNFKAVNDTLGHPQGDAVLKIIARLIRKEVRAIDLIGRYGGEEFIVLLPETGAGDDATSATGALVVAERIRKAVDEEFRGLQKPLNLSVSIGVAVRRFPEEQGLDYRELIRLADEQLYRAKTTGKNKVCTVRPEQSEKIPS